MRDYGTAILIALLVIVFFAVSFAWTKFQWTECRKDADHSFWFCLEHISND